MVAFADDFRLVALANDEKELMEIVKDGLRVLACFTRPLGPEMTNEKTEAGILRGH